MKLRHLLYTLICLPQIHANELGVLDRYTSMRTIAGTGLLKNGNFWQPAFEGADPRVVELSNPHDCGTDARGNVYIVDKESHSVLLVNKEGTRLTTIAGTHNSGNGLDALAPATTVALNNPNGLHVLANGTFFILDTDNRKIRRVSPEGTCTTVLTHAPGFGAGRGLWVSEDEQTIYFCGPFFFATQTQAVMKYTPDGGVTELARLPAGTRGLGNLDVAPDQSVGVTSAGDHRVYRLRPGVDPEVIAGNGFETGGSSDGSPATAVALDRVRGISFLPDGSYFLATQKGGDIWWVDLEGKIYLFVSGSGSGNDQAGDGLPRTSGGNKISEPRAIHLASNGDLLITSNDTGVIRAVTTICHPQPPQPTITLQPNRSLNLSFKGLPQGQYILEASESLNPNSWFEVDILTTEDTSMQNFTSDLAGPQVFWRLRTTEHAGGS